jgi:PhnB protein
VVTAANPYLNFDGNTEEAFGLYRSVFGGDFMTVLRYRDFPDNPMGVAEHELDKIAHIALPLGPNLLMANDIVGPWSLTAGTNFYIAVDVDTDEEADRVFDALSAGGRVDMALQKTEWAQKYGICVDPFGVQWMVSFTGDVVFGG